MPHDCTVPSCIRPAAARGICNACYQAARSLISLYEKHPTESGLMVTWDLLEDMGLAGSAQIPVSPATFGKNPLKSAFSKLFKQFEERWLMEEKKLYAEFVKECRLGKASYPKADEMKHIRGDEFKALVDQAFEDWKAGWRDAIEPEDEDNSPDEPVTEDDQPAVVMGVDPAEPCGDLIETVIVPASELDECDVHETEADAITGKRTDKPMVVFDPPEITAPSRTGPIVPLSQDPGAQKRKQLFGALKDRGDEPLVKDGKMFQSAPQMPPAPLLMGGTARRTLDAEFSDKEVDRICAIAHGKSWADCEAQEREAAIKSARVEKAILQGPWGDDLHPSLGIPVAFSSWPQEYDPNMNQKDLAKEVREAIDKMKLLPLVIGPKLATETIRATDEIVKVDQLAQIEKSDLAEEKEMKALDSRIEKKVADGEKTINGVPISELPLVLDKESYSPPVKTDEDIEMEAVDAKVQQGACDDTGGFPPEKLDEIADVIFGVPWATLDAGERLEAVEELQRPMEIGEPAADVATQSDKEKETVSELPLEPEAPAGSGESPEVQLLNPISNDLYGKDFRLLAPHERRECRSAEAQKRVSDQEKSDIDAGEVPGGAVTGGPVGHSTPF